MKKTEKYIVFRNQETGAYLVDYKNEGTLAYITHYIREIKHVKQLNGEDAKEIEMSEEAKRKAAFSAFLNMLGD